MKIGTPQIQKILQEKVPPLGKDDPLTVTNSVVILLSMKVDMLEKQNAQLIKAVRTLAQSIAQGAAGGEVEDGEEEVQEEPIDRTPFPAGASPGPVSSGPAGPAAQGEDLTPNNTVVGGPTNVQPIPKGPAKTPANNGSKTVRQ